MIARTRPFEILYIEDNPADCQLLEYLFSNCGVPCHIVSLRDGKSAMDLLQREGEPAYRPDLVLLDLNLPRIPGKELLQFLKSNRKLDIIPVIVLSTSSNEADKLGCYELGANAFITKPLELSEFDRVVKSIELFWLQTCELPFRGRMDA